MLDNLPPTALRALDLVALLQLLSDPKGLKSLAAQLEGLTTDAAAAYDKLGARQGEIAAAEAALAARITAFETDTATLADQRAALTRERDAWAAQSAAERAAIADGHTANETAAATLRDETAALAAQRAANARDINDIATQRAALDARAAELNQRQRDLDAEVATVAADAARLKLRLSKIEEAATA